MDEQDIEIGRIIGALSKGLSVDAPKALTAIATLCFRLSEHALLMDSKEALERAVEDLRL